MKKHKSGKLQLRKISIVSLSPLHAQYVLGGDGTETTILQPKPTTPPPPQPQPAPPPPPTKTKASVVVGHECTVIEN